MEWGIGIPIPYFQTNPFVRFVCKFDGQASKIVEHAGKQTRKTNKKEHI